MRKIKGFKNKKMRITVTHFRDEMDKQDMGDIL